MKDNNVFDSGCCSNPQIIEHTVASDVKEGDYFAISVKHAKYADVANSVPNIVDEEPQREKSNRVILHLVSEGEEGEIISNTYEKEIDNVANAETARYDTKHRELSKMLNEEDAGNFIDLYLSNKNLVWSVNNRTGNVILDKTDVNLGYVDNTADKDKPVSIPQQEALDKKQNKILDLPLTIDEQTYDTVEKALHALNDKVVITDNESIGSVDGVLTVKVDDFTLKIDTVKHFIYAVVDDKLDEDSKHPVENGVITKEVRTKAPIFQYYELPEPTAELHARSVIYEYIGKTVIEHGIPVYERGHFYEVVKTGENSYAWEEISVAKVDLSDEVAKAAFDVAHPIGEVYVQYPWTKDPESLYNHNGVESKWELIDYDGAFFRAEGGNADKFQEEKEVQKYYSWPIIDHEIFLSIVAVNRATVFNHNYANGPYTEDDIHIKRIEKLNGEYWIETLSGRTEKYTGTQHIFNFDQDIGSLDHLFAQNWTKELIQETIFDSSNLVSRNFASATGANPSDANKIILAKPYGYTSEAEREAGIPAGLNMAQVYRADNSVSLVNPRTQLAYADNASVGHIEGQWTPWGKETIPSDVMYAYPPQEEDTVYSITNTATPTDAQIIVKIERLREQDNYAVMFKDGHTANYKNSDDVFKVGYDFLNDAAKEKTLISQNMGDIRGLFDVWTESSAYYRWYEFPETDEYCYCINTSTTPTDAQIIVAAECPERTDYNGGFLHFKDGHITAYDYNDISIYRVDKVNNKNKWICWMGALMMFQNDNWTAEELTDTVHLPNESEELILSTASAATPSDAQRIKCIHYNVGKDLQFLNDNYKNFAYACNYNGTATVWEKPNTITLYNKNTAYGTANILKIRWAEGTYNYMDPITEEVIALPKYEPEQPLFFNGNTIVDVRKNPTVDDGWLLRYVDMTSEEGSILSTTIATSATLNTITDEEGEEYKFTPQSCRYNAIVAQETHIVYRPPESGTWYQYSGMRQYLWNTTNGSTYFAILNNLAENIEWNAATTFCDPSTNRFSNNWSTHLLEYTYIIPGTEAAIRVRKDGYVYTNTDVNDYIYAGDSAAKIGTFGVMKLLTEVIHHYEAVPTWVPPELGYDGNLYVASNASAAVPNDSQKVEYIIRGYNNRTISLMNYLGWYTGFRMPDLHVFDRNKTDNFANLYAGHNWRIDAEDIAYILPPEQDWLGDEYIASIASAATPTDAQRIVKIDPLEGSTNYNIIFADGHSAVYPQTQAIYNRNKYYTTIYGIYVGWEQERRTSQSQIDNPPYGAAWSTAKTVPSLPANHVMRVRWLEGTSTYLLYMEDGSYKSVAHDTVLYNTADSSLPTMYVREAFVVNWSEEEIFYQEESVPNIEGSLSGCIDNGTGALITNRTWQTSDYGAVDPQGSLYLDASRFNRSYGRRAEVAPKNYTIRVWERVLEYSDEELRRRGNVGSDF